MRRSYLSQRSTKIIFKLMLGIIIFALVSSSSVNSIPDWEDDLLNPVDPEGYDLLGPDRFTENDARSELPQILTDDEDNIHLIWVDSRNDPDPDDTAVIYELFYKKYDKDGNLLVGDTRVTDASHIVPLPGRWYTPGHTVALDSEGNIHVSYMDFTYYGYPNPGDRNVEIYYMKWAGDLDCGGEPADRDDLVLVDELQISDAGAHSGDSDLAVDSEDNVYIVWYDHRSTWWNWEIYLSKLSKDGDILIDEKRLSYYTDYNAGPEIAIDPEDNLHIMYKSYVWSTQKNDIYYLKLDSSCDFLVNPKIVFSENVVSPERGNKAYPYLDIDSENNVHVFWHDERFGTDNYEISYLKLDPDGDALMTGPQRITHTSGKTRINEVMIDDLDRIHISWRDETYTDEQVYLAIMRTDGSYHLEPYELTVSEAKSQELVFAFESNGNVHLAWTDGITGNFEIFHAVLVPPGLSLAFVPTGKPGASVDVTIYQDDRELYNIDVERSAGNPMQNAVVKTIVVDPEASYRLEMEFEGKELEGKGNGAIPMKVYLVEDVELTKQLTRTVLNSNEGKSPKLTATIMLDDIIDDYFQVT